MLEQSVLIRRTAAAIEAAREAIRGSWTASFVRRYRITHVPVVITSACVTHIVLLQLMPDRLAPVKPLAYGMVLAFAAFVAVVGRMTRRSSATATADSNAGTAKAMNS